MSSLRMQIHQSRQESHRLQIPKYRLPGKSVWGISQFRAPVPASHGVPQNAAFFPAPKALANVCGLNQDDVPLRNQRTGIRMLPSCHRLAEERLYCQSRGCSRVISLAQMYFRIFRQFLFSGRRTVHQRLSDRSCFRPNHRHRLSLSARTDSRTSRYKSRRMRKIIFSNAVS